MHSGTLVEKSIVLLTKTNYTNATSKHRYYPYRCWCLTLAYQCLHTNGQKDKKYLERRGSNRNYHLVIEGVSCVGFSKRL